MKYLASSLPEYLLDTWTLLLIDNLYLQDKLALIHAILLEYQSSKNQIVFPLGHYHSTMETMKSLTDIDN